ncbi:MAG TPA: hypothetical protein VGS16_08335 [Candidatus Dormibacteraeota bacterium]|nr:hypothetical protein [Candidatus Dormibacteraeota bacterium]
MLPGKSKLLLLGATLVSTVVLVAVASLNVLAGEGNANYLGVLSSTAPSGYTPSPTAYTTGATVSFQFNVTNLTAEQQSMNLELTFNHIITYKGMNVSDGQPGVPNGAVVDGGGDAVSTQVADPSPTFTAFTIAPNATQTLQMSRVMPAGQCGYYQVDVAKAGLTSQKGLIGLEIRVLGCVTPTGGGTASPTPEVSPTATPGGGTGGGTASPTPAVSPTATPTGGTGGVVSGTGSPSPSGGVLGSTATTPPQGAVLAATGMTSPVEVIALVLLGFAALVLITGLTWRRRET